MIYFYRNFQVLKTVKTGIFINTKYTKTIGEMHLFLKEDEGF